MLHTYRLERYKTQREIRIEIKKDGFCDSAWNWVLLWVLTMSIVGTTMKIAVRTTNGVMKLTIFYGTDNYSFGCQGMVILRETW